VFYFARAYSLVRYVNEFTPLCEYNGILLSDIRREWICKVHDRTLL